MERPTITLQPIKREVTGEIAYLENMRRLKQQPNIYTDLSDAAIQLYETEAAMYRNQGVRPPILDLYEQHEPTFTELSLSCIGLADELLTHKNPEFGGTSVSIVSVESLDDVVQKLKGIRAGILLADNDKQLAMEFDGTRYPKLDIKKRGLIPIGVDVMAWGWSTEKYVFTDVPGIENKYPENCLRYPSDERSKWYEIDVRMSYQYDRNTVIFEIISLYIGQAGDMHISSQIYCSAYSEQGYEGHGGMRLKECSDGDIVDFADLVAEIVGDEPMSVTEYEDTSC